MTQNAPGQRIGKGMLYLFWIAVLLIGTWLFNHWIEKKHNPNQVPNASSHDGVNQVTLQRNRYHHYVASGLINGKTVTLMLDTGATEVSIPKHLAKTLNLREGAPRLVNTANGTVETRATTIESLQLGSITWQDVPAHINPGMQGDQILLGMSALKNVEFTHRDGTLTLKQYY